MNTDDLIKEMQAFDNEGAPFMTPVQYAKIRPIGSPQLYAWMRNGALAWKRCDCGRRVIDVETTDELLRSKGKLPPKGEGNDER
jgi:hypothetical protein